MKSSEIRVGGTYAKRGLRESWDRRTVLRLWSEDGRPAVTYRNATGEHFCFLATFRRWADVETKP